MPRTYLPQMFHGEINWSQIFPPQRYAAGQNGAPIPTNPGMDYTGGIGMVFSDATAMEYTE